MTTLAPRDGTRSDAASDPAKELASASVTAPASSSHVRIADVIETRLPWLFLLYAVPFVITLSIIMAPFQVADELAHIERADQISRGKLIADRLGGTIEGGWVAIGALYQNMWFHSEVKQTVALAREAGRIRRSGPKEHVNFQGTAQYGPFLYMPQVVGLLFGRLAHLSLAQTLVGTRMLNGLAACLIGFLALSICRLGRTLTFVVLVLPMTLSQFSSASQDALLISLTILAVAMASRLLTEQRLASTAEFAIFAVIVVVTTLARPPQFALALLAPAFIGRRDPARRSKVLIAAVAVMTVICWMRILSDLTPPLGADLSPTEQFHRLLEHPLLLPTVMVNYFVSNRLWFSKTIIGYLGWTDTLLPDWYYLIAAGTLLMALLGPGNRALVWWARILAILTFVALVTLLSIALFMTWTPVGLMTIHGMQGRYLLGMLPLLAWTIPEYNSRVERALTLIWYPVLLFPLVTWVITLVAIMERYYGTWAVMAESVKALLL